MSVRNLPSKASLKKIYEENGAILSLITRDMEDYVQRLIFQKVPHVTVKARPKSFDSYFKKYIRYLQEHPENTSPNIPDQIGLRVICPFIEDLEAVEAVCREGLQISEIERKGSGYSFKEFGYESIHLLVKIPEDILKKRNAAFIDVAEIQIRTILQDAWAEVEHELVYKTEFTPYDDQMKRKLAAVNASLCLADTVFQEIRTYQRQFRHELDKRHSSFFNKVEEFTVDGIFDIDSDEKPRKIEVEKLNARLPASPASTSIDDLLLNALYVHNKGQFEKAIEFYTKIIVISPPPQTKSIIYKHRGMAFFAMSRYEDAVSDFSEALKLDPKSYKAVYYRAVVREVEKNYTKAAEDFSFALELNPYQPWAFYRRAQVYYHIDDYPAALADCEDAIRLNPDFEAACKFKNALLDKLKM